MLRSVFVELIWRSPGSWKVLERDGIQVARLEWTGIGDTGRCLQKKRRRKGMIAHSRSADTNSIQDLSTFA